MIAPRKAAPPCWGALHTSVWIWGRGEGAPVVLRVARFSVKAGAWGMDVFSVPRPDAV